MKALSSDASHSWWNNRNTSFENVHREIFCKSLIDILAPFGYWIENSSLIIFFSHFSIIVTNTTHLHEKRLWTWAHYFKLSSRHVHFHRCSTIHAYDNWEWVCDGNWKHHSGWCCQRWHRDWNKSSREMLKLAGWVECEYLNFFS